MTSSSSSYGISQITLQFDLNRDIDAAAQDVQAAINAAGSTLPRNLPYPPTYAKVNPADAPIVTLALTSPTISLRQLSDLADTLMAQRLSEVAGVGHVSVQGGIKPGGAHPGRPRAARRLRHRLDGPAHRHRRPPTSPAPRARSTARTSPTPSPPTTRSPPPRPTAIGHHRLPQQRAGAAQGRGRGGRRPGEHQGRRLVPGHSPPSSSTSSASPAPTSSRPSQRIKARAAAAAARHAERRRRSPSCTTAPAPSAPPIHDVQFTLVLSVGLVVLVVLLFLRTIRATIIAGVALPLSLVATFGVMWFCGFSLDNLSLMALTIGTGFVVDDAIVMIENIVRHIEKGESPMQAALKGAREIGFTVISLTLSLIAVFIPLLFMTGLVGRMFREFALTLTIAVVVSAIVSLTLTPMMCSPHAAPRSGETAGNGRHRRFFNDARRAGRRATIAGAWNGCCATSALRCCTTLGDAGRRPSGSISSCPRASCRCRTPGLITAVMEAAPRSPSPRWSGCRTQVDDADPQGPRRRRCRVGRRASAPINATPNAGHLKITLKPARPAHGRRHRPSSSACSRQVARHPRRHRVLPAGAGRADQHAHQPRAVPVHAGRHRRERRGDCGRRGSPSSCKPSPVLRDVASEAQDGGLRADGAASTARWPAGSASRCRRSTTRSTTPSASARSRPSTRQANQYRVVLEAMPQYQSDPAVAVAALRARQPAARRCR